MLIHLFQVGMKIKTFKTTTFSMNSWKIRNPQLGHEPNFPGKKGVPSLEVKSLRWQMWVFLGFDTLQGTNISRLWKGKSSSKVPSGEDMLVPRRANVSLKNGWCKPAFIFVGLQWCSKPPTNWDETANEGTKLPIIQWNPAALQLNIRKIDPLLFSSSLFSNINPAKNGG